MVTNLEKHSEKALKTDLNAYKKALEIRDLRFANIISNRMNTTAIIANNKESVLISTILKIIIQHSKYIIAPEDLDRMLDNIINKLGKISLETKALNILSFYSEVMDTIFEKRQSEIEEIYKQDISYSKILIEYFIDFLISEISSDNIDFIIGLNFPGTLNEILRVFKNYGFTIRELMLQILLEYFSRVFDYYRYIITSGMEKTRKKSIDEINNYLSEIKQNLEEYKGNINDKDYIEKSVDLLFEICKEWRLLFVRYMEIMRRSVNKKEINLEFPNDIKKNMKEIIKRGIDSEISGKDKLKNNKGGG